MMTSVNPIRRGVAIVLVAAIVVGVAVFGAGRLFVPRAERIEISNSAPATMSTSPRPR
jgi:hypothetical protein